MKKNTLPLLALLLISLPVARSKDVTLFVLAGQSNAEGWMGRATGYPADTKNQDPSILYYWNPRDKGVKPDWTTMQPQNGRFPEGHFGPEVTFSRKVLESGENPAVFKFCRGSTSIGDNWQGPGSRKLYDAMVTDLRHAIQLLKDRGDRVTNGAFIWIQGESDAIKPENAAAYEERLKTLIGDMRTNVLHDPNLLVILGCDEKHSAVQRNPIVITAQEHLAATLPNCIRTSMLGLPKADGTHLRPEGLVTHGERLFDAYRTLKAGGSKIPQTTTSTNAPATNMPVTETVFTNAAVGR